jgi:hypothetical protein
MCAGTCKDAQRNIIMPHLQAFYKPFLLLCNKSHLHCYVK